MTMKMKMLIPVILFGFSQQKQVPSMVKRIAGLVPLNQCESCVDGALVAARQVRLSPSDVRVP